MRLTLDGCQQPVPELELAELHLDHQTVLRRCQQQLVFELRRGELEQLRAVDRTLTERTPVLGKPDRFDPGLHFLDAPTGRICHGWPFAMMCVACSARQ